MTLCTELLAALKSATLWIEATAEMTGDDNPDVAPYLERLNNLIAKAEGKWYRPDNLPTKACYR